MNGIIGDFQDSDSPDALLAGLLCTFLCLKIKKRKLQASEPEPSPVLYDDVQTLEMPQVNKRLTVTVLIMLLLMPLTGMVTYF